MAEGVSSLLSRQAKKVFSRTAVKGLGDVSLKHGIYI